MAITQDTALDQGMSRATQYGDFLAKSVLHDHLTKVKKKDHKAAMKIVTEEFVNYNLLPGRTRGYLESMGLGWFWTFKLRSLKVAMRHFRDHPVRGLLVGAGVGLTPDFPGLEVGSPSTDNIVSTFLHGDLGYTAGWGMLFRGPSLNPWFNIVN